MTTYAPPKQELRIPAPELRGAALALGSCTDREVCIEGSAGCIAGETRLYNPMTGEHTSIRELYEQQKAPIVQTLMGAMQADVPFRKGVADLYRVKLASGRECIVTGNHLFLTPDGWRFASSCLPSQRLLVSAPCHQESTEVLVPSVSQQDALHLSRIPLSSQERYSAYPHRYDARLQWETEVDPTAAPLSNGAHEHTHADLYTDDWQPLREYTHPHQYADRRAMKDYSPSLDDMAGTQFPSQQGTSSPIGSLYQDDAPFLREPYPLSPTAQALLDGDNTPRLGIWSMIYHSCLVDQLRGALASSTHWRLGPYYRSYDMTQESAETPLETHAYNPSFDTSKLYYTAAWDTVSSIKYERTDEYFDLHVPVAEHYLAEGIWHHNTGKTVGALFKIHVLLSRYPGARALVARKTNTALSGSAMVTYRDNILRGRRDIRWFGGNKVEPAAYRYPNGSEMIVNGLDKPEKVMSSEFEWAYINEAIECELDDIEFVRIRLRPRTNGPNVPYRQLIMDVNPDAPDHWLNQRMNEGITTRLTSYHQDNPRYFDARTQDWTEEGREYIFGILEGLTGVRRERFLLGKWVGAEGSIYEDAWDRRRNVIDRFPIPQEWPRYLVVDFGFTNPFVCKWYAMDGDGRGYVYRELYKTKRLVEDHAKQIKQHSQWGQEHGDPLPRMVICDHDAEDRATLERHLGLITYPAQKNVSAGIQVTAARYRPAGDGKPRLMYFRDCLIERDRELANKKKPMCSIEEVDGYIWDTRQGVKKGEAPLKEDDHGMDCDRYFCAHFDLRPGVRYSNRIY